MQHGFAVNARFVTQPLTGVQRFCYELSQRLRNGNLMSPGPALPHYGKLEGRVSVTGPYLAGHAWEQFALPLSLRSGQGLLSPAGCGPIGHPNQVVVLHDLTVLEDPEWYSRAYALWYARLLPALARRVRRIVTVSQFCKTRIIELLRVPEENIVVALEAASSCFFPRNQEQILSVTERLGVHRPFFLAVGAISPRKNFARLTDAWRRTQNQLDGANLIFVGKEGLRFSSQPTIGTLPARVTHLGPVNEEDLAALYSGARGLLYPSLHEGFGLPILEAMACGCPVLTSNCTAMPEVAGDAAVLVDPLSEESIAGGIRRLAQTRCADELKVRGLERSRRFSWARTAEIVEAAVLN
jgi:glycosyltransferase involved in cell wall biosynthesis